MKVVRKLAALAAIAALGMAALTGCGGGSDDSSTNGGGSTSAAKTYPMLRVALSSMTTLDLVKAFNFGITSVTSLGLEGLMRLDASGRVVPNLATAVDNPDATTYVYTLRSGVRFSDGAPLTADDVVYSLDRARARDSQLGGNYGSVASVRAQGADKVVVTLSRPDVAWPYVPAFAGPIVEQRSTEAAGKQFGTPKGLPVGTGPWKFDSFDPATGVELSRNESWWGGKAPADQISVRFIADAPATALALRSGDIDGTIFATDPKLYGTIPGTRLLSAPGVSELAVSFNTTAAPFDDLHVRRAIAYALDRDAIVQAVYSGKGQVDDAIVPPALYGNIASQSDVDALYSSLTSYGYDLDAARSEMAASKTPDGFATTILADTGQPELVKLAQIMVPALARIGIRLTVKEVPNTDWLAQLLGPRKDLGMFLPLYTSAYPDPNSLLTYYVDPAGAGQNGVNVAAYTNDQVGSLLDRQRSETDGAARFATIGELLRITQDELPYAPIAVPDKLGVLSDRFTMPGFNAWSAVTPWALNVQLAG